MDRILIRGGRRLEGRLPISGAKNAALTLMPCALLTDEPLTLRNLPRLADIDGFGHLLNQLGASTKIEGTRPDGAAFYACKHQAMFETLELQALLDGPAIVLKRELADIPAWGWAARRYGAIVVDRDASAKALRNMMREAIAAKATGRSVLIFPEGTRSPTNDLLPFKDGAFRLAIDAGVPILPLALHGTGNALPKHDWRFGRSTAVVEVLEPVETTGLTAADVPALKQRVRETIIAARDRLARQLS